MTESRAKSYMARTVKTRMRAITPSDLGLTDDFKINVLAEANDWIQFRVVDPSTGSHYLTIKVTEHVT